MGQNQLNACFSFSKHLSCYEKFVKRHVNLSFCLPCCQFVSVTQFLSIGDVYKAYFPTDQPGPALYVAAEASAAPLHQILPQIPSLSAPIAEKAPEQRSEKSQKTSIFAITAFRPFLNCHSFNKYFQQFWAENCLISNDCYLKCHFYMQNQVNSCLLLFCFENRVTRSSTLLFRVVGTRHPRSLLVLHLFFEYVTHIHQKSLKCQRSGMLNC